MKRPAGRKTSPRPIRVRAADAPAEAVERIVPKRLSVESGDVVIAREALPIVNVNPASFSGPQFRYKVCVQGKPRSTVHFNTFGHAATRAEELGSKLGARVMFIEDGLPVMLADYRV